MYIEKEKITPFKEKIWLSSPTMHGEELKYVQEACKDVLPHYKKSYCFSLVWISTRD